MSYETKELAAKIEATNLANKLANERFEELKAIFRPYVGQKVCKAEGELIKKIADQLPKNYDRHNCHPLPSIQFHRNHSKYSIGFTFKVCVSVRKEASDYSTSVYAETTVYLYDLQNGVIPADSRDYEKPEDKIDYTLEDVLEARRKAKEAKEAYEKLRSACFPFFE